MISRLMCKKPIILVGNGVRESGASRVLYDIIKKMHIPILTSMNAVDMIQDEEKIGFIGVYGNRVANIIAQNSDYIIAVGIRLGLRQIGNNVGYFNDDAHLVRVDIDQYELSRTVKCDEEKCLMDAKKFLDWFFLNNNYDFSDWYYKCKTAQQLLSNYDKEDGNLYIEKISNLLPSNPIVCVDIGQNQCWAAQSLHLKGHNGRIIIGGSYGAMGCGLPYAIGASFASDKETVFCITGDGGLQMNIQELQTVYSEKLPIKIFVINNTSLGKIREIQEGSYGSRFSLTTKNSGYTVPNFENVSNAYGIKSATINDIDDIFKYKDWLEDNQPCLLNLILQENSLLLPKMNWNHKNMLPALDDSLMNNVLNILN